MGNPYVEEFDIITSSINQDPIARCAAKENTLRFKLSQEITGPLVQLGGIGELAETLKVGAEQIRKLLHIELGGRLALTTIVRAADLLDMDVEINLIPRKEDADD